MKLLDYDKFMAKDPTRLGMVFGVVELYEHPRYGDEHPLIGVNHISRIAFDTGYYDPWDDIGDCESILEDFQQILIDMGREV
jgi:hypothetical protein